MHIFHDFIDCHVEGASKRLGKHSLANLFISLTAFMQKGKWLELESDFLESLQICFIFLLSIPKQQEFISFAALPSCRERCHCFSFLLLSLYFPLFLFYLYAAFSFYSKLRILFCSDERSLAHIVLFQNSFFFFRGEL